MADKPRIYLDSCCFIDMAKQEVGITLNTDRTNDVWHLKQLLQATRDDEISAFTSTLTIAECTSVDGSVPKKVKDIFTRLLMSGQYVVLVQPTPFIMQDGRDLKWVHGLILRGADSVHVASALDRKCDEFITTDDQVKTLKAKQKLLTMGLRVICGRETQCLPAKYRQTTLGLDDGKNKNHELKPDDKEQSKAFIEKAREIGADEEKSVADDLLGRLTKMPPKPHSRVVKTKNSTLTR